MFLYFLDKNQALFVDGKKKIADSTLVALTIMIAKSRPEEKELMRFLKIFICWNLVARMREENYG